MIFEKNLLKIKDFHGSWDDYIGHNSPLYPRENEPLEQRYLNIDYLTNYYLSKGLSKEKLILGLASYGRSFKLANSSKNDLGSAAKGKLIKFTLFFLNSANSIKSKGPGGAGRVRLAIEKFFFLIKI